MNEEQNNEQEEVQDSKLKQAVGRAGKQVVREGERQLKKAITEALKKAISAIVAWISAHALIILAVLAIILVATIILGAIDDYLDGEAASAVDEVTNNAMDEYCTIDEYGVHFDKDKFVSTLPRKLKEEMGIDFNDLGLGTIMTDPTGYFFLNPDSQAAEYLYKYMAAALSSELPYIEGSDEETKGIIKIKRKKSDITVEKTENTKGYIFVGESHVHKLEEALTENDIFVENPSTYVSNSINSKNGKYKYEYGTSGNGTGGNLFFIHTLYDGTEPEYGTSVSNMTQQAFPDWIYNGDSTSNGVRTYQGTATAFERIKKIISNNSNIKNWNVIVMQGYSSALLGQGAWDSYLNNLNSMKSELSKLGSNLYVSSTPHSNAGIWQQDTCYSYGKDSIINNLQGPDSNDNNAIYDQYNEYIQNGFYNFINVTSSQATNSRGKDGNEYKKYEKKLDSSFYFDNYAHIDINHYDSSTMYAWGEYIINALDGNIIDTLPSSGNTNQNSNNTEEIELKYIGYNQLQDMINSDDVNVKKESLKYFSLDSSWNLCVTKWRSSSTNGVETSFEVSEVKIPYRRMVSQYTIPFTFLMDLQLISQNANYVEAVSKLMTDRSFIDFTIFDSVTTDETTYTYEATAHTKKKHMEFNPTTMQSYETGDYDETTSQEGPDVTVTKIETDSIKASVTKAKTWIIDQTITYNLQESREYPYGAEPGKVEESSEPEPSGEGSWRDPIKETWYEEIIKREWIKGAVETKFMPDEFLGLWSNKTGIYVKGASYATTRNGGKLVKYKTLEGNRTEKPVENIIISRESLYDILAENQTTQIHSEIMKEIINFYLSGEELTDGLGADIISLFNPSEFIDSMFGNMNDYTYGSNLKEFIHSFEGKPKESNGQYVVFDDGFGNATVGWGIYIKSHYARFSARGVDATKLKVGDLVDKSIVDSIEDEIIAEYRARVLEIVNRIRINRISN